MSNNKKVDMIKVIHKLEKFNNHNVLIKKEIKNFINRLKQTTIYNIMNERNNVVKILNRLSFKKFIKTYNYLDKNYPGLSLHILIECRVLMNKVKQTQLEKDEDMHIEASILINRLNYLKKENLLNCVLMPMRVKLAQGLLEEEENSDEDINNLEKILMRMNNSMSILIEKDSNPNIIKAQKNLIDMNDSFKKYKSNLVITNSMPILPVYSESEIIKLLKTTLKTEEVTANSLIDNVI